MKIKTEMNQRDARRLVKAYQLLMQMDRILDNEELVAAADVIEDMFPISEWIHSGEEVPKEYYDFLDWAIGADFEELMEVMMEERPKRWISGC